MGENEKPVMVLPKSVNINKLTGMIETCKIILNDRKNLWKSGMSVTTYTLCMKKEKYKTWVLYY